MKQAAAILQVVILVSFFLPWFGIDVSSSLGIYGGGYSINPFSRSMDMSLAKLMSSEITGGYLSFLWIIPILAIAGLIYSTTDPKEGYSWLNLYPSSIALFLSGGLYLASQFGPDMSVDYRIATAGASFRIGLYLTLLSSLALWILSIVNNVKHYREYKKLTLFHLFIPICVIVCFILMISSFSILDYGSYDKVWGIILILGLIISFIIVYFIEKKLYDFENYPSEEIETSVTEITTPHEIAEPQSTTYYINPAHSAYYPQPESVVEEKSIEELKPYTEDVDTVFQTEDSISIKKKYLYWVAGVIVLLLLGWFIYSRMDIKMNSSEDYSEMFFKKYKEYPDKSMALDENRLAFIKNTQLSHSKKISIYIMENKKKNPQTLQTIELEEYVPHNPIDTVWIENIDGKEYLYLECMIGGGSMGNHLTRFSLYELNGNESYILNYEFYPENVSQLSEFERSESLDGKPRLLEFLKEKMRTSEYYKMDKFFTFIDGFCSDEQFQLSRIKFPVSYIKQQVAEESEIDENTYYDAIDGVYIKEVPVDKSEWRILGKDAFTTLYDSDKNYFARWEKVSRNEITFSSGWVDSEYDVGAVFKKINGEWYLTRYWGGN